MAYSNAKVPQMYMPEDVAKVFSGLHLDIVA